MKTALRGRAAPWNSLDVFSAISDPTRRRLLDLLARGERPVKRLASFFPTTRSAVSQHLHVLHAAGLVSVRKAGREHLFRL
ncbi:MAG: ArsR/SmtB family transcription factor, partial [Thermoanaerobaculia bacterium]